jgi:hypothetical protein
MMKTPCSRRKWCGRFRRRRWRTRSASSVVECLCQGNSAAWGGQRSGSATRPQVMQDHVRCPPGPGLAFGQLQDCQPSSTCPPVSGCPCGQCAGDGEVKPRSTPPASRTVTITACRQCGQIGIPIGACSAATRPCTTHTGAPACSRGVSSAQSTRVGGHEDTTPGYDRPLARPDSAYGRGAPGSIGSSAARAACSFKTAPGGRFAKNTRNPPPSGGGFDHQWLGARVMPRPAPTTGAGRTRPARSAPGTVDRRQGRRWGAGVDSVWTLQITRR